MTRYTVVWKTSAQNELTEIWLESSRKSAVADAANVIDRELATDAHLKGEEYYGDRALVVQPLGVVFSVSEQDRQVLVLTAYGG